MMQSETKNYSFNFFNCDPSKFDIYKADQIYILDNFQISSTPREAHLLMLYYFGIFICAEAAFIFMAIKEYLQDILGFSEQVLIDGPKASESTSSRKQ